MIFAPIAIFCGSLFFAYFTLRSIWAYIFNYKYDPFCTFEKPKPVNGFLLAMFVFESALFAIAIIALITTTYPILPFLAVAIIPCLILYIVKHYVIMP